MRTIAKRIRILTRRLVGASLLFAAVVLLAGPGGLEAQAGEGPVSFNVRGGLALPTFDIADVADPGGSFGAGVKVHLDERLFLRGNADFGFHPGASPSLPDVDVFHYVAGLGYRLTPDDARWYASVNLGAGALTFAPEVPGDPSFTYFAINAGGQLGYRGTDRLSVFLSPPGAIAFSDDAEVGTGDAWVWPLTAGLEFRP